MVKSALEDIDAWLWTRKKKYLAHKEIAFVCGSRWLANEVRKSPLYERASVTTIPSSIDTTIYAPPWDKYAAKKVLGIDDRKVIMFGADNATGDPRKGYDLLEEAWNDVAELYQIAQEWYFREHPEVSGRPEMLPPVSPLWCQGTRIGLRFEKTAPCST